MGVFKYVKLSSELSRIKGDSQQTQAGAGEEQKKTIERVKKLMALPEDEVPTVAVVADAEKLKNQGVFLTAKNDDRLLVYTKARRAILYRPSENRIIDVAPVNIATEAAKIASESAQPTPRKDNLTHFLLRNGTEVVGLTRKYETEVTGKVINSVVDNVENAVKRDYQRTILVDMAGDSLKAGDVAKALGIVLSDLPQGEATAEANFIVIVGKDFADRAGITVTPGP